MKTGLLELRNVVLKVETWTKMKRFNGLVMKTGLVEKQKLL